ncbi:hypothetical protein BGZ95_007148 [Linnemannia exigua]|uniref:C2H2-type domain-containing protein n=1 Tax=Linnemannia exigua TaxID=604196 RepID=A0AAD4H8D3_9FUNG|nr:hypothetical protein BGZ95_007148 [Linnemannia exigua]
MSPTNILVTAGQAKVPRTRARSRTLPTLGDLEDILVEPLAQPQPLLTASSQQTGGWSGSTLAPTDASSVTTVIYPRTTPGTSLLVEALPPSKVEELDSASPSPFHDKDMEVASASEDAADLENDVEETAVTSRFIESSSSSLAVVVSTRQPKHHCPRCSKMFTRPFNLRSHILAHDNEKPYACDGKLSTGAKCKSRFARRHDLVRHIKAKHPDYSKDKDQRHESRSSIIDEAE